MSDPQDLAAYVRLADQLIDATGKEQLADAARLLALSCGYYQTRFGDVPRYVLLRMAEAESIDNDMGALLAIGMQRLIAALAQVAGLADDGEDQPLH
jgi:hypothetical protein